MQENLIKSLQHAPNKLLSTEHAPKEGLLPKYKIKFYLSINNKSWKTYPAKQQRYALSSPILQNIQDVRGTAGDVRTNWKATFSDRLLPVDELVLAIQQALS